MATKIRLKRIGRRNRPFYRLIVIDSRKKRDGAAIEQVGWYNPISTDNSYEINDERILHWLGEGAIPSDAVKKNNEARRVIASLAFDAARHGRKRN